MNFPDGKGEMARCIVSFVDLDGIRHSVEVEAEGLYEASVLGICAFRKDELEPFSIFGNFHQSNAVPFMAHSILSSLRRKRVTQSSFTYCVRQVLKYLFYRICLLVAVRRILRQLR
jgi:hypothetical protein